MAGSRPFGVTLVAIIAWVNGALQILCGLFSIFPGGTSIWAGPFVLVLGIITILVAFGLFSGSNVARVLTTIVFALNIASGVITMTQGLFWQGLGSIILPLIGILLLFTARANEFFRR